MSHRNSIVHVKKEPGLSHLSKISSRDNNLIHPANTKKLRIAIIFSERKKRKSHRIFQVRSDWHMRVFSTLVISAKKCELIGNT